MKKLTALLLSVLFIAYGAATVSSAAENPDAEIVFEEDFERYEKDVNVNSTSMTNLFVCDYNSIGDGMISVQETSDGNLYLLSHVFTQIYTGTPVIGGYEFSLDIIEAQGRLQSGVLIRAPKTDAAYYEGDGYPDTSTCLSGLYLTPHSNSIGVNVKTYNASAASTSYIDNNVKDFALPDGVKLPYNLTVKDDTEKIEIYCGGSLICSIVMSEPGKTYENHQAKDPCFAKAVLYDASGGEIASYDDPLLQSSGSIVGWSTRASNMAVDNVKLSADKTYAALLAINAVPAKVTAKNLADAAAKTARARELYDALTDEQKALITNSDRLAKAEEAVKELTPATTEKPEEPTGAATEPPAQTQAAATEPLTDEKPAQTADNETGAAQETETRIIDDSLTVWILIAVMIALVFVTAGFVAVKRRK